MIVPLRQSSIIQPLELRGRALPSIGTNKSLGDSPLNRISKALPVLMLWFTIRVRQAEFNQYSPEANEWLSRTENFEGLIGITQC